MTRLVARGLGFSYGPRQVLHDVALDVAPGVIVGLVGPNGSGKTTLLKLLAGLLRGLGEVRYDGTAIDGLSARQRARKRAFVPQGDGEPFPYSVGEVVAMGLAHQHRFFTAPAAGSQVQALLNELGFPGEASRSFAALSGGERQIVMVARALLQASPLLLLDEPTSHLDLKHQAALVAALKRRATAGMSVVCSLHDLNLAALACDELVLLAGQGIAARGTPAVVLEPVRLQQIYDVPLHVSLGTSVRVELDSSAWR